MKETICKANATALLTLLILSAMCATAAAELPATFDWRDVDGINYTTPVKNQLTCGACWDFATMACVESAYKIYVDPTTDLDLSEQYFISDCYPGGDCNGGYPGEMLTHLKHVGTPSEACFPYISANCGCTPCSGGETESCKIVGFLSVDETTAAYKQALYEYGPIVAYRTTSHTVCVVGWNDTTGDWIYKNSCGTSWGDDGYGTVPFGDIETVDTAYVVTGILNDWTSPISATASSTWCYTGPPSAAIDGGYDGPYEVWSSDFEVPCWIQFDLGEQMSIDAAYLSVISPEWDPAILNLSVSADNNSWTSVAESITPPLSNTMFELPIDTTTARYIRLDFVSAYERGVCLEFGVIETTVTCKGDFCGDGDPEPDGDIDAFDFVEFCAAYGSSVGDTNYNSAGDFCGDGDPEPDGDIDAFDFVEFAAVFETSCG